MALSFMQDQKQRKEDSGLGEQIILVVVLLDFGSLENIEVNSLNTDGKYSGMVLDIRF